MNKENEEFMLRMMQMFEKQNEQHQAAMTALVQAMKGKSNDESRADMTPTSSSVSQTQLMNDIGSRVAMFQFDLETEKTFSKWYARHEAAFTVEGKDLEDKSKVSLLMSKMSDEVYEQYSKRICPRKHTEVEFDETVKTLEQMFDIKKSLFSHRFACINIARDDETPVEYTTKVNSMCESAMLQDIDAEGWKVFFWLKGLDASRDKSARTYFIRYVEQKWEKKESVNVNDLCEEWKKLLRQNSVVQEMEQVDKAVRALHTRKDFNRNHKKLWNREQSNGKVDECWNCGKVGHRKPDCVQRLTKCLKCQKTGHLSKYCKSKGSKKAQSMVVIESAAAEDLEVNAVRQYVMVEVNDQLIEFQLDTGSDITLISRKDWMKVGEPELEKCPMKVKSASGNEVKLLGRAKVDFMLKGSAASDFVHVREHGNLLGLDWISKSSEMTYHMNMMVNELKSSDTESIGKELKEKFPEVFLEGLGTCTKEKAVLTVKDKSSPVFIGKRPVPYGALETVEQELDRLESLGVLKKVNHSSWAAPLVCVKKKDTGALRICADFKTGLNGALQDEDHPIPTPEDVFATLNGGTVFSTVDLKDAYFQIELAEESKPLLTVNTHRGLYQYQRLPFGAKTAPMVFQRIMDKMITGLSGVTAYLDDVIIVGRDEKEHNENLFELFQRIAEYGFRVKLEKCRFLERRIKFLGFIIDRSGRRPDEEKVQVIKNMCEPKDQKTLRSFMGMVTYYSAFIPKMKTLRGSLDKLLMKDAEWRWTKVEAESFQKLKDVLSSDLNLTHYMPKIPIVVAADACDYGIGAVISHRFADGTEKPIAHAARSLNSAEKNYSQIEKEGLGLIFAVKRFHKYLFGRKFLLRTDHKPLLSIFGSKKGIPVHSQNRLVRWSTILLAYDFDIEYVKTDEFGQADALSRMIQKTPLENEDIVIAQVEEDVEEVLYAAVRKLPIRVKDIQEETWKSSTLKEVINCVSRNSWPKKPEGKLKQFFDIRSVLSVVQNCLMFKERVVIPEALQKATLRQLHEGHPGIVRMKQLARSFVSWPRMDSDIEKLVAACTVSN
uniref:RNA-directed DNA polymerase n=2 Tax=Caenorhabditis japonica TaxID=281687 RepID=A0A8R1IJM7_CAEJA